MDAWEILISNSTLATGDAWEHINNQESGGTGETVYVYAPDPTVTTSSFGDIHISSDSSLPYLNINSTLDLKPIISSNNEETSIIIDILKPSLHIQEE